MISKQGSTVVSSKPGVQHFAPSFTKIRIPKDPRDQTGKKNHSASNKQLGRKRAEF